MRVLLDSSVLIAAHISRASVCAELFEDVLLAHELLISEFTLGELSRKLQEKFKFSAAPTHETCESIRQSAEVIDPVDLPVLGAAVAGKADLLITVDKDLLDLKTFENIPIVKPGEFWKLAN